MTSVEEEMIIGTRAVISETKVMNTEIVGMIMDHGMISEEEMTSEGEGVVE
jgi:hypothetical protein